MVLRHRKQESEDETEGRGTLAAELSDRLHATPPAVPRSGFFHAVGKVIGALLLILALNVAFSYIVTDSLVWNQSVAIKRYFKKHFKPPGTRVFTESELARHDGTDPELPIYLAINGSVFDVTAGRKHYGPKGGYAFFSGKDAARAFVTGCFADHLTHDIRGLNEKQLHSLAKWIDFYRGHIKYDQVGTVLHAPIDPASPIPPDCKDKDKKENIK